ncbi:hypothetical protein, partial [Alistipes putredinis]|uniref:hypothetical protein n=2 Tax=Rikenellaceae TaxID=171550 RepID=UPI003C6CAC63
DEFATFTPADGAPSPSKTQCNMKKQKITQQDYLKAHRKASREEEIARHGRPARFRAVHKSKKAYDRKREKAGLRNLPFSIYPQKFDIRNTTACLRAA